MILKLTEEQKKLIQNRLEENQREEKQLRKKQETEDVSGWDFMWLKKYWEDEGRFVHGNLAFKYGRKF
jgi:hypothetical protein